MKSRTFAAVTILLSLAVFAVGLGSAASSPKRTGFFTVTGKIVNKKGEPARDLHVYVAEIDAKGGWHDRKAADGSKAGWAGEGTTGADGSFSIKVDRSRFSGEFMKFSLLYRAKEPDGALKKITSRTGQGVNFMAEEKRDSMSLNGVIGRLIADRPGSS